MFFFHLEAHGMRNTHASVLLSMGVRIIYVSKRLGHHNIATTYKHYAHLTTEMHKKDRLRILRFLKICNKRTNQI
ncbi:tyrosine-type recombinase/integrase [Psychrobacillus sp. FSL K6-2836]|uniref:tyrosine-type recombinase/integrase n=1 Tax=Psychrobacillus sp. FSL K6-2836 TaxID=2921548 RepID=UPI004040C7DB